MRATLMGCALLFLATRPVFATTYHVAPDSSGDFPNVQAAIDAAVDGDEIVLADGTFTGDGNWDLNLGTKELVVRSLNGFEATSISLGYDVDVWAEHRGFIIEGSQSSLTKIEGITVENGAYQGDGVAIRCVGASPEIRQCRFRSIVGNNLTRGLGIFVQSGAPLIEDCVIEHNLDGFSGEIGVAIYAHDSQPVIRQCAIRSNSGSPLVVLDGGEMADCEIYGNWMYDGIGTGIRLVGGSTSIRRCVIRDQLTTSILVASAAAALVEDCEVNNVGSHGGAGSSGGGTGVFRNCRFIRTTSDVGASTMQWCGTLVLDHCLFLSNTAYWAMGSTITFSGTSLSISHCTFADNTTYNEPSALEIQGGDVTIDHSIIAFGQETLGPVGPISCEGSGTLTITCTDIYGNEGGDWVGCTAGMEGQDGNISADPLFCDLAAGIWASTRHPRARRSTAAAAT